MRSMSSKWHSACSTMIAISRKFWALTDTWSCNSNGQRVALTSSFNQPSWPNERTSAQKTSLSCWWRSSSCQGAASCRAIRTSKKSWRRSWSSSLWSRRHGEPTWPRSRHMKMGFLATLTTRLHVSRRHCSKHGRSTAMFSSHCRNPQAAQVPCSWRTMPAIGSLTSAVPAILQSCSLAVLLTSQWFLNGISPKQEVLLQGFLLMWQRPLRHPALWQTPKWSCTLWFHLASPWVANRSWVGMSVTKASQRRGRDPGKSWTTQTTSSVWERSQACGILRHSTARIATWTLRSGWCSVSQPELPTELTSSITSLATVSCWRGVRFHTFLVPWSARTSRIGGPPWTSTWGVKSPSVVSTCSGFLAVSGLGACWERLSKEAFCHKPMQFWLPRASLMMVNWCKPALTSIAWTTPKCQERPTLASHGAMKRNCQGWVSVYAILLCT